MTEPTNNIIELVKEIQKELRRPFSFSRAARLLWKFARHSPAIMEALIIVVEAMSMACIDHHCPECEKALESISSLSHE